MFTSEIQNSKKPNKTKGSQIRTLKFAEYNTHMLKYSVKNPNIENDKLSPDYLYPFAEYDRWVSWVQNIGDRHILNGQRDVYLQKNMEDTT